MLASSAELFTTLFILRSKYLFKPTLKRIRENAAIKIEGNKVVVEKKAIYFRLVSDPSFPLFFFF